MFSSLGLFKQVDCPESPHCSLPTCIFSHRSALTGGKVNGLLPNEDGDYDNSYPSDGPRKRRKINGTDDEVTIVQPPSGAAESEPLQPKVISPRLPTPDADTGHLQEPARSRLTAASRPISPPPLSARGGGFKGGLGPEPSVTNGKGTKARLVTSTKAAGTQASAKPAPIESLNPRMMAHSPAPHGTRLQLIKLLHEQMVRLNELVKNNDDPSKVALELSPQELVSTVLDEEMNMAKKNPSVYSHVMKLRIVFLRKMDVVAWKQKRLETIKTELLTELPAKPTESKPFETGLPSREEIIFLSKLTAKQEGLAKHGYVTTQLTDVQVKQAQEGVKSSNNWEACDRCQTRFQVFPGRRAEDGVLTTGGDCRHHPARARRPAARDKADKTDREPVYLCCNEVVGRSAGCTTGPTHVFKVSEAKRLALIMPFQETPENKAIEGKKVAVCFDCEMGYTTYGMELIRITATSFPSGTVLLDTLVRPLGEVLDLNSRYSGVWPKDFTSAIPSDGPSTPESLNGESKALPIASSPAAARSLLFKLISPSTPLIGHALENDLNATRIIHPCIIDTVLLFPHVRGLPLRHGLKQLMKKHLNKDIQVNHEGKGHDSAEDARSAGELVRVKIKEMVAREGMQPNGKMDGTVGRKRSVVEIDNGVDAMKRGMESVGEVLKRVS